MTGPDAMHGEMPGFFPGRPGGERDEPLLDMIFDRRPLPPGAPPEMHDLARLLTAVACPGEPEELAGEATALAAFARHVSPAGISPAASRPARRWLSGRPARARLPLAAALVTAAAGLGGITAAYAGVLPGPIQHFAHDSFGAPRRPVISPGRLGGHRPAAKREPRHPHSLRPASPLSRPRPGPRQCQQPAAAPWGAGTRPQDRRSHLHPEANPHPHAGQPGPGPEPASSWSVQLESPIAGCARLPDHRQPEHSPASVAVN